MNLYIIFIVFSNGLGFTSIGCALSWASPALVKLQGPQSPITMDSSQISWLGSSLAIGAMAAAFPYTYFFNRCGRKRILGAIGCLHILGWIILMCSKQVWHLYLGKFVHGLAVGPTYGAIPVYLAEVVGKSIRGSSVAILIVFQSVGSLIQYVFGPDLTLFDQNLYSVIVPVLYLVCSLALPESPYYLARIGTKDECVKVLMRVNSCNETNAEEELKNISDCLEESPQTPCVDIVKELYQRKTRRILLIITIAIFAQHISGVSAIIVYMQSIFIQMKSSFEPKNAVIIAEIVAQTSALVTLTIINRIGRKKLLVVSSLICIVAHIMCAVFFYTEKRFSNLGVYGIMLLQIGYGCGLGSIPVILMSEIMSYNLKGCLSGYYQQVQGTYVALTVKLFQIVNDNVGDYCTYSIFAICLGISVSILLCIVPETRNRTLQEIQRVLGGRESRNGVEMKEMNEEQGEDD